MDIQIIYYINYYLIVIRIIHYILIISIEFVFEFVKTQIIIFKGKIKLNNFLP